MIRNYLSDNYEVLPFDQEETSCPRCLMPSRNLKGKTPDDKRIGWMRTYPQMGKTLVAFMEVNNG